MPRLIRHLGVVALLGVLALLAMHGIASHDLGVVDHHVEVDHATAPVSALATSAPVGAAPDLIDHDDHDHEDDHDGHCRTCSHDAGAPCASIVLVGTTVPHGAVGARAAGSVRALRPPRHTWSPDPPVPKSGLVPRTTT